MFSFLTSLFSSSAIKIGIAAIVLLAGFWLYARGEHFRAESIQAQAQVERLRAEVEGWRTVSAERQKEIASRDDAIARTVARYEQDRIDADESCQRAIKAAIESIPLPATARVLKIKDSDESINRSNNLFPALGVLPGTEAATSPSIQANSTGKNIHSVPVTKGSGTGSR